MDILDAIDGALNDWEVSDDAMRWRPEKDRDQPPPRQEDRLGPVRRAYYRSDLTALATHLAPAMQQLNQQLNQQFDYLTDVFRRNGIAVWHRPRTRPPEEDPWERALRLRRTRNTGPTKPLPDYRPPHSRHIDTGHRRASPRPRRRH